MLNRTDIKIRLVNQKIVLKYIENIQDVIRTSIDAMDGMVYIHLMNKIEDLAKTLGCEIKIKESPGRDFPIEKSITFKGVKVFQLEKAQ